jgi:hypothetical protein
MAVRVEHTAGEEISRHEDGMLDHGRHAESTADAKIEQTQSRFDVLPQVVESVKRKVVRNQWP